MGGQIRDGLYLGLRATEIFGVHNQTLFAPIQIQGEPGYRCVGNALKGRPQAVFFACVDFAIQDNLNLAFEVNH